MGLGLGAVFFTFACSLFGQIDAAAFASDLRAKYGPPLARETFLVRPEVEMVVDYADNGHVCRIELPPIAPGPEPEMKSTKAIDDLVTELVPPAIRGKELRRGYGNMGLAWFSIVEYENVTISESGHGTQRTGVTVMFRNESCHKQTTP